MATVTISYLLYKHVSQRQPRISSIYTDLIVPQPLPDVFTNGGPYTATAFPGLLIPGSSGQAVFAFMTVLNGTTTSLYSAPGSYTIPVATSNVTIQVIYVAFGSGPGLQVFVDAYDLDTNLAMDDNFVNVADIGAANGVFNSGLTQIANVNGTVSSAQAEELEAYNAISGKTFTHWERISPTGLSTLSSSDYNMPAGDDSYLFAFYKTPVNPTTPPSADCAHQLVAIRAKENEIKLALQDPSEHPPLRDLEQELTQLLNRYHSSQCLFPLTASHI